MQDIVGSWHSRPGAIVVRRRRHGSGSISRPARPARGRVVLAALLAAVVSAACTVRVELTAPRMVPGDLAARSSGLAAPPAVWSDEVVDERAPAAGEGLALATLLPADGTRGPVDLLPEEVAPAPAAADLVPAPATGRVVPIPAFRPAVRTAAASAKVPRSTVLARFQRPSDTPLAAIVPAAGPGPSSPTAPALRLPPPAKPPRAEGARVREGAPPEPARPRPTAGPRTARDGDAGRYELTWISPERLSLIRYGVAPLLRHRGPPRPGWPASPSGPAGAGLVISPT